MPWIKVEDCTGCGICVEECPADAIAMESDTALIDMTECIRCGTCHDVCPEEAVRHDSETIPLDVAENVAYAKRCAEACVRLLGNAEEGPKCLNRCIKYFTRAKKVAEKTIEELEALRSGG
ncbi:MAG: 4Fe-4S binding protein [Desulfobacteraceae bacterium]|jgi:ferredoxin